MVFFLTTAFINIILLLKFVGTEENTTALFQRFINHYHRVYQNPENEERGYMNFVNNLNEVNRLNKEHPGKVVAFQLNRYADLDPVEINEHFGIDMKPYDHIENNGAEMEEREKRHKFLEDMHLYDLNEVDDLYHQWINKWGKANFTKKLESMIHYYRFVKTVAETNKKKFAGQQVTLGPNADVINEPNEFFYG